jgi:hypothetical protein
MFSACMSHSEWVLWVLLYPGMSSPKGCCWKDHTLSTAKIWFLPKSRGRYVLALTVHLVGERRGVVLILWSVVLAEESCLVLQDSPLVRRVRRLVTSELLYILGTMKPLENVRKKNLMGDDV